MKPLFTLFCVAQALLSMPAPAGEFSDADVAKLIQRSGAAEDSSLYWIYIWSPHMNYSVMGLREARRIARLDPRVQLIPILDPNAQAQAGKDNHPVLTADRLIEQGALLHFPAVFYVSGGRLSPPRLGYDPPALTRELLRQNFK